MPVRDRLLWPRLIRAAREGLDMDVAFVARIEHDTWRVTAADGETLPFGLGSGRAVPLCDTLCGLMLSGALPSAVGDLREHGGYAETGAYLGVPLREAAGPVRATLCVRNRRPTSFTPRDLHFMRGLARSMALGLTHDADPLPAARIARAGAAVDALMAALAARDGYTAQHTGNVVRLALEVGAQYGLNDLQLVDLAEAARLHDVGKLGISDAILRKPGPLDMCEWEQMRAHPVIGARIVGDVPALRPLAPVVRAEHERWDGGGYPDGLAETAIPLASRIVFACDAYDAMTSDRPYRPALPDAEARLRLRQAAGTQFDPRVVATLLRCLGSAA